jgi:HSP20 family protein
MQHFTPFSRLHHDINRLFEDNVRDFWRTDEDDRKQDFSPSLDVDQGEREYEITVELPGVAREDVEVEVRDDYVTISGSKNEVRKSEKNEKVESKRHYGRFQTRLSLPDDIDRERISANFANGVLTLTIPRDAEVRKDQVRKIEVKSGNTRVGAEREEAGGKQTGDERHSEKISVG